MKGGKKSSLLSRCEPWRV